MPGDSQVVSHHRGGPAENSVGIEERLEENVAWGTPNRM